MPNISVTFQAIKKINAHLKYLRFRVFVLIFFVIFEYIWGEKGKHRISEIYGNKKFERFDVVLKLEFEVKNW